MIIRFRSIVDFFVICPDFILFFFFSSSCFVFFFTNSMTTFLHKCKQNTLIFELLLSNLQLRTLVCDRAVKIMDSTPHCGPSPVLSGLIPR